jgi:hypothetical protein
MPIDNQPGNSHLAPATLSLRGRITPSVDDQDGAMLEQSLRDGSFFPAAAPAASKTCFDRLGVDLHRAVR